MKSLRALRYLNIRVPGSDQDHNRVTFPATIDLESVTIAIECHDPFWGMQPLTEVWVHNRPRDFVIVMDYEEFEQHWMTYVYERDFGL